MKVQQLRQNLHLQIDQADPSLLRILNTLVSAYIREQTLQNSISKDDIPSYNFSRKPLTAEDLKAEIQESRAAYEKGNYYTLEDLEKDMETW